jgi:hypothetical protein
VSNSSSSSFILATDKKKKKILATVEVDLSPYIEDIIGTVKQLDKWFIGNHGWDDKPLKEILKDKNDREEYHKYKEIIEKGKKLIIGGFESDGEAVESMLCDEGLEGHVDKDIEIIDNDGGY